MPENSQAGASQRGDSRLELDFASAERLAALVRSKAISPTELMDHALKRIEALNPTLNAFIALDAEAARAEAARQTERVARGEALGPLGGLPLGVKDLENAAGLPTTFGSRVFRNHRPERDDVHVERLRAAGAIVVGKTNTPEFGYAPFSNNELFGPSRNPWNTARTPGGSSGGSAAALAGGLVPLATASDGGGSIRIPAAYTGLYGLKPSYGRVPIGPRATQPWMNISVYGPLTRSVRDAALYLDQVAGPHGADPMSLPPPAESYLAALERPLPKLRVAFNRTLGQADVPADVMREVESAVQVFRDLGHEVVDNEDAIPQTAEYWIRMFGFQALASLWDEYSNRHEEFSADFVQHLDASLDVNATDFRDFYGARGQIQRWTWELFEQYDLLLTPTLASEAFAAEGPTPIEKDGAPHDPIVFTYPFNFTGHPAASVRAGFTDAGLPCGLQIVGLRHRDDLVLQASYAYEQARPWQDRWPSL